MRAQFTPIKKDIDGEVISKPASKPPFRLTPSMKHTVSIGAGGIIVALILVALGVWIARRSTPKGDAFTKLPGQVSAVPTLTEKQVQSYVETVGKHMILPKDTPTIVQISNVEQLKIDQPFFRSAVDGDQLLVYPSRVILYRPSLDRVVDIAQIRANTGQTAPQSSPSGKLK